MGGCLDKPKRRDIAKSKGSSMLFDMSNNSFKVKEIREKEAEEAGKARFSFRKSKKADEEEDEFVKEFNNIQLTPVTPNLPRGQASGDPA